MEKERQTQRARAVAAARGALMGADDTSNNASSTGEEGVEEGSDEVGEGEREQGEGKGPRLGQDTAEQGRTGQNRAGQG